MNKALLVGINQYPSPNELSGCINDVMDMAEFLVAHCHFSPKDVRLLTDERATTKAIRDRLDWLVKDAKSGDRLFFHYSGHGVLMADRTRTGKVKGPHNAVCPVDFDFSMNRALTDDDFQVIFQNLPADVEFNWVSDSCHAGDLARDMAEFKPRSFPVPVDLRWRLRAVQDKTSPGFARAVQHLNGALLAGCRSDQTSADATFGGRPNGAMTFFLLKTLHAPRGLTDPLVTVIDKTSQAIKNGGFDQVPTLQGNPQVEQHPFLTLPKK
jgi:hypothetical protein